MHSFFRTLLIAGALLAATAAIAQAPRAPSPERPRAIDTVPADAVAPFGGLAVFPTRLIINDRRPTGEITLYNSGAKPVELRMSLVELRQTEQGAYEPTAQGADSLASHVRFAPRQVTLGPSQSQVVKFVARAPHGATPQEFRSHLQIATVPPPVEPTPPGADTKERTVSLSVAIQYQVTLPVLLQIDAPQRAITLHSARAERESDGKWAAVVSLARTGAASVIGRAQVRDAAGIDLGATETAIYAPLARRVVRVPLAAQPPAGARVLFISQEVGDKDRVLTEGALVR